MTEKTGRLSKMVAYTVIMTIISVLFVFLTSYTKYIYAQDYDFIIESSCNPEEMSCYVRDCDEYCPPNALELYSVYTIPATEYSKCTTNSCENICQGTENAGVCEPILCSLDNNDDCTS